MNGLPAGFGTMMEASGCAQGGDRQASPQILDDSDGPARLVFVSASGWRYTARIDRWLAIVRVQPPAGRAARVIWLLDAGTVRWPGGLSPGELHRVMTGREPHDAPVLWFRAHEDNGGRRGFTASGAFGAAGIVDAARVRVAMRRMRRKVRLRMTVDPAMWDLWASAPPSGDTGADGVRPAADLTITASGVLRPLEPQAISSWL